MEGLFGNAQGRLAVAHEAARDAELRTPAALAFSAPKSVRDFRLAFLAPVPLAGHGVVFWLLADRPEGNVMGFGFMLGVGLV